MLSSSSSSSSLFSWSVLTVGDSYVVMQSEETSKIKKDGSVLRHLMLLDPLRLSRCAGELFGELSTSQVFMTTLALDIPNTMLRRYINVHSETDEYDI